jgi:hypothetical protein
LKGVVLIGGGWRSLNFESQLGGQTVLVTFNGKNLRQSLNQAKTASVERFFRVVFSILNRHLSLSAIFGRLFPRHVAFS